MWDSIASHRDFPRIAKMLASHNVTENPSDPHWLATAMEDCMGRPAQVWNAVMANVTAAYFSTMAVEPLLVHRSEARANQYGFYNAQERFCVLDPGGYQACTVNTYNGSVVGTHQTLSLYNTFPGNGAALIRDRGYRRYAESAFNTFKYDCNRGRMLAAAGPPWKPWLAFHNFSKDTRHSDYYAETALHTAVMGADNMLFFNPYCPACGPGALTPDADNALFSRILAEATDVIGCKQRTWLLAPPAREVPLAQQALENTTFGGDWDDEYVLSGTHLPAVGTTVYRFTPNTTAAHPTPQSYVVATQPNLLLEVPMPNNTTRQLNFTGGVVYTPPQPVSKAGLWIFVHSPDGARYPEIAVTGSGRC